MSMGRPWLSTATGGRPSPEADRRGWSRCRVRLRLGVLRLPTLALTRYSTGRVGRHRRTFQALPLPLLTRCRACPSPPVQPSVSAGWLSTGRRDGGPPLYVSFLGTTP